MSNLSVWNKVKRPPEDALKSIKGGRLKGMTDISPQWRYQIMTEVFGVCGTGWKYEIKRLWTEVGSSDQVMAFAEVLLYIKQDGAWGDPIPGIGGAALIAKESSGLHSNDEAYKMAVTDGLSVALKMLGVAADIYSGKWDGSKYKEEEKVPSKLLTEKQVVEYKNKITETTTKEAAKQAWTEILAVCKAVGDKASKDLLLKTLIEHGELIDSGVAKEMGDIPQ